ncbi:MAG: hypothetical protein GWP06_15810 [Actinobacteria bacterium]|nr:hypothetical protein [Actinomycetota bacterium]
MILRGINFGPVLGASGVQGFFGEGYWYHKFLRPFGLNFDGCAFVAKTTALNKTIGNMSFEKDGITPKEFKPNCIKINFFKGVALNAIGLSGPGAKALFEVNKWQCRKEPFFLSFMATASSLQGRIIQLQKFVKLFKKNLPFFHTDVGLQINYSCPNVGLNLKELSKEIKQGIQIASELDIPLMPKFNITVPFEFAKEISELLGCDAICVSNTLPWKHFKEKIACKGLFGSDNSPLAHLGGGGLSGKLLLPLVADWVRKARRIGIRKPINAGGGILASRDVNILYDAGASSVFIGSIAMLRPWRVKRTIARAYKIFNEGDKYGIK